jgi:hypothetical protein
METTKLDMRGFGAALSGTLVVLVIICAAAAAIFPDWQLAHGWLSLFSASAPGSLRNFIEGIVYSVLFGWIAAAVFVPTYNFMVGR